MDNTGIKQVYICESHKHLVLTEETLYEDAENTDFNASGSSSEGLADSMTLQGSSQNDTFYHGCHLYVIHLPPEKLMHGSQNNGALLLYYNVTLQLHRSLCICSEDH